MNNDPRQIRTGPHDEWSSNWTAEPGVGNDQAELASPSSEFTGEEIGALVKSLRDLVDNNARSAPQKDHRPSYLDLAAAAEDLIFVISLDGSIEYLNPAAASFLRVAPEAMLGQSFDRLLLLPDSSEAEELLADVISREEVVHYERAIPRKLETVHLYTTLSPVRDGEGTIAGILGIAKDVSALAKARDELRSLSMVDELTGVYNRRGFMSMAAQHLSLAQRSGSRICLVMADVDRLKFINDRFGHERGDEALITLAAILKGNCRKSDIVARLGGDEFALLASGISEGSSEFLVARLRQAVKIEDHEGGKPYRLSASIGAVECAPGPSLSVAKLLSDADSRMYEAKRARAS